MRTMMPMRRDRDFFRLDRDSIEEVKQVKKDWSKLYTEYTVERHGVGQVK